jgi:hypothetical protein
MEFGQEMSSTIIKYLNRMGVDEALFHAMAEVPSEDIAYLDHETLRKWNLLGAVPAAPPPEDLFVRLDGYDAIGGDLPNMRFQDSDAQSCENRCRAEGSCSTYTLNKQTGTCFLKGTATVLFRTPDAITGYRSNGVAPRFSSMRTISGVALLGDWHIRGNISYVDCALGCESDTSCVGFTHDLKDLQCVYFKSVTGQPSRSTAVSGIKQDR